MGRVVELAHEYLSGMINAREFRSKMVGALSRIISDDQTRELAQRIVGDKVGGRTEVGS